MFFAFHQKGNDLKKFVADELEKCHWVHGDMN